MSTASRSTSSLRGAVPHAVVIGLDSITGLQTARILTDRGVPVVGMAVDDKHWGARTNACVEVVQTELAGEPLIHAVQQLGKRLPDACVLVPCTDSSVDTLSRHRAELDDQFILPLAPHSVVELLMDKLRFAQFAAAERLPVPATAILVDRPGAEHAAASLDYPCVLKPPTKSPTWVRHTSAKAFSVEGPAELLAVYDKVGDWAPVLLAQEWVSGPETGLFSCNAYFDEQGAPLVTFVARKIRQWPPGVGTSSAGEECRNEEVLTATLQLFGSVGYHGLAYLEMKRDVHTGRLLIIEPNLGRPTGRSAIAEAGGVDLVYTAYCDAAGLPLPESREQRYVGAKWLDLRRDLQAAIVANRRGTLSMGDWARSVRGGPTAHAIWSRRDPVPFVVDLVQATSRGGRMLARHVRSSSPGPPASPRRPISVRQVSGEPRLLRREGRA